MEIKTTSNIIFENQEVAEGVLDNKYNPELKESFEKKWVTVESLLDFIKSYETSLGDLPKELSDLKKSLSKDK